MSRLTRGKFRSLFYATCIVAACNGTAYSKNNNPANRSHHATPKLAQNHNNSAQYVFHIPTQNTASALALLSKQANINIASIGIDDISNAKSSSVRGLMTLAEALSKLLANTEFDYKITRSGIIISRKNKKTIPSSPPIQNPFSDSQISAPAPIEHVLIVGSFLGQQSENEAQDSKYINNFSLSMQGGDGLTNLENAISGVSVGVRDGTTRLFLRGSGTEDVTELGDPSVTLHLDGLFISSNFGLANTWYDIDQVEVNYGPRVRFGGKTGIGGSVNLRYHRPDIQKRFVNVGIETGSYALNKIDLILNAPVTDTLGLRVSAQSYEQDSFYTNISPLKEIDHPGRRDDISVRTQLLWQPNHDWETRLLVETQSQGGSGSTGIDLRYYLQSFNIDDVLDRRSFNSNKDNENSNANIKGENSFVPTLEQLKNHDVRRIYFAGGDSEEDTRHNISRIDVRYDGFENSNLTLQLAYRELNSISNIFVNRGIEYPAIDYWPERIGIQQYKRFNDASFAGTLGENIEFHERDLSTVYTDDEVKLAELHWKTYWGKNELKIGALIHDEDVHWFKGYADDYGINYIGTQYNTLLKNRFYSLFTEVRYSLDDHHFFGAGLRYSYNTKKRKGIAIITDGNFYRLRQATQGFEWNIQGRTIFNPHDFHDPNELDSFGQTVVNNSLLDKHSEPTPRERWEAYADGILSFGENDEIVQHVIDTDYAFVDFYVASQNGAISEHKSDWQISYSYEPNAKHQIFAAISHANASGGINDNITSNFAPHYSGETVSNIEFGFSRSFRRLQLNNNLFLSRIKNKLIQLDIPSSVASDFLNLTPPEEDELIGDFSTVPGTPDFRLNVPKAETKGVDISLDFQISDQTKLKASVLFLDARYKQGAIPDSRLGAFSSFINTNLLRFNSSSATTIYDEVNQSSDDRPYKFSSSELLILIPDNSQKLRTDTDWNGDNQAMQALGASCSETCTPYFIQGSKIEYPLRNIKNNYIPRSPRWTSSLRFEQQYNIAGHKFTWHLVGIYKDKYFLKPFNGDGVEPMPFYSSNGETEFDIAPSLYDRVDAMFMLHAGFRIDLRLPRQVSLELSAYNLTDQRYMTDLFNTAWNYTAWYNEPRTWRASVRVGL